MAMLEMDVAALSPPQMKRLLEVMRERGQHELANELSIAWKQRYTQPGELRPMAAPAVEQPADPTPARSSRRWAPIFVAGVAAVAVAGLAWGLNLPGNTSPELPPAPPPVVPVPAAPRADLALTSYAPPAVVEAPATSRSHNPCYDLPTPGERLVCGFPVVAARHKRLEAAYDTAIAAGVRPAALGQSAWSARANRTRDRGQYMALMESRIREIEAMDPSATP
jgi:hypothetical protein